MKLIKLLKTEKQGEDVDGFLKGLLEENKIEKYDGCICILINKRDGFANYCHTLLEYSEVISNLEITKQIIIKECIPYRP
jgi:hypothetical protein